MLLDFLSVVIDIENSVPLSRSLSCVRERYRSLSHASEALEISSLRKISLLLYKEFITKSKTLETSALNSILFSASFVAIILHH